MLAEENLRFEFTRIKLLNHYKARVLLMSPNNERVSIWLAQGELKINNICITSTNISNTLL